MRTVRLITLLGLAALICGCASKGNGAPQLIRPAYYDAPAPALVFDPPVALDEPQIALSRNDRQPALFIGFYEARTTFYHIRTDDRHDLTTLDRTYRRAVIDEVGVSYR